MGTMMTAGGAAGAAGGAGGMGSMLGGMMGGGGGGGSETDKSLKVGPSGNAPVVPLVDMRSTPINNTGLSAIQQQYYKGLGG